MLKDSYYHEPSDLDRQIFEKLVAPDHYLRHVKRVIDFDALRPLVADCYSSGVGRGAEDPVRLIKMELLQFQYGLSDRDVVEQAHVNVAFRFFLDLSLESPVPSHGLLSQFRSRLGPERHKRLFDAVIAQARAHGLVRDRLRLKDATHVIACVAIPATLTLVAQARDRLLEVVSPVAADAVQTQRAEAEHVREVTRDATDAARLVARVEHLRRILAWVEAEVLGGLGVEDLRRGRIEEAVKLARKVLSDREPAASDRLRSLEDPQVRTGKHGAYYDGYLLDLSVDADSELITAVTVQPANVDESADAVELIKEEEEAHGNDIEAISMDGAGFRGEALEALGDAEDGPKLTVYVPVVAWPGSKPGCFTSEAFELSEDGEELRCPGGQVTRGKTRTSRTAGVQFTYRKSQCATCPLREHCLGRAEVVRGRQVVKSDYERQYQRAREVAGSEAYRQVRREHPRVERRIADLVRNHGGRRVRYRGLTRVRVQYYVTAMAANVKRMVKILLLSPGLRPA
jgi:transposase